MKWLKRNSIIPAFDIMPEDVLFPGSQDLGKHDGDVPQPDVPIAGNIFKWFFALIIILGLTLFIRTAQLAIVENAELTKLSQNNAQRIFWEQAPRGVIFDRNGEQLMINVPRVDLLLVSQELPRDTQTRRALAEKLAPVLNITQQQLLEKIPPLSLVSSAKPNLLAQDLTQDQVIQIQSMQSELPGVRIVKSSRRSYQYGKILAHILGYTGRVSQQDLNKFENYLPTDNIGKIGIEQRYEELLRGRHGYQIFEETALGQQTRLYSQRSALPGQNLMLTINAGLQKKAYETLESTLKKLNLTKGAVVALEPNSGEVLALVSIPSYDPNLFAKGITAKELARLERDPDKPLFNRAIAGTYPPGSTIKPIIAMGALENDIIDPEKSIYVTGSISVPSIYNPSIIYTFHDWKRHGWVNMRKAIAVSSNVYFYTIGGGYKDIKGLGIKALKQITNLFGLGSITGIDLAGEDAGRIPDPLWKQQVKQEDWYIGDTYNFSIGQGDIAVTPLQMTVATAVFANGGYRVQPHLLKAILDSEGQIQEELKKDRWEKVDLGLSTENIKTVKLGMRDAVRTGTAGAMFNTPFSAAGKTGTAQFGVEGKTHAWFTVFAPYENPKIVLTVLIENTKEGSFAAIPVAKQILTWYFNQSSPKGRL